ncbi:MAG: TetR/AcrR family transcriptional regulator, partial [Rhizobiaceae bacterium]
STTTNDARLTGQGLQFSAEASCSKETLYSWFSDRDGIFAALVEEQAQSMGAALDAAVDVLSKGNRTSFEARLLHHAIALLDIMTGHAVIAVNRIAMSQTCVEKPALGEATRNMWDIEIVRRFEKLFAEGARSGDIAKYDTKLQFDGLLGLLVGDRQRRLLLGENARPKNDEMHGIAQKAVTYWLRLNAP